MKIIFLASLMIKLTFQIKWGSCPTPTRKASFDKAQFIGIWYDSRRYKNVPWETRDCPQVKYTSRSDGKLTAFNSQYSISNDKYYDTTGTLDFTDGAKGTMTKSNWINGDFQVLDTDYTGYAIIYSCNKFLWFWRAENAWIFTRTKPATVANLDNYFTILNGKVDSFASGDFKDPNQSVSCKYLSS